MRESTTHALVVARTLLEQADPLCLSDDRYLASAGLIVLQDALESVIYALLLEKGIDEEKNLERKGFDELMGELRSAGVTVPKSATLKALNKQRVLAKHYAQLAEPVMVRSYHAAAREAIILMTREVCGQTIYELFISDLLKEGESRTALKTAEIAITERKYLDALIEIRKAIFVEFEEDYNVFGWRNYDEDQPEGLLSGLFRGGWRAPYWMRKKEWIEQHVKIPTDYIQIDHQDLRLQAMELGIHTVELQNLQRLTPAVFRASKTSGWSITYDASFETSNATEANARYCLDRAISIVLKKHQHANARREPSQDIPFDPPPIYLGHMLHERPSRKSSTVHVIQEGFTYSIRRFVGGFDPEETFYEIFAESVEESTEQSTRAILGGSAHYAMGYLLIQDE